MPIIQFNLLGGRTNEQKRVLARRVTDTVVEVLARISHTYSAAAADLLAKSGCARKTLLNILSSMPSSGFTPRSLILRHLDALATNTCEKCGLSVAPETVRILIHELGPYDFAVAGVTAVERGGAAAKPAI